VGKITPNLDCNNNFPHNNKRKKSLFHDGKNLGRIFKLSFISSPFCGKKELSFGSWGSFEPPPKLPDPNRALLLLFIVHKFSLT
jgi:hypothetical protein